MKTKQVLSFHGDHSIKDKYLKRLEDHYKADQIIKGKYWENGKGCAVGCTVHASSAAHDQYPTQLGISWRLALLEDGLFERMPNADAKEFPIQFLKAIPVGVDTDKVFKKFVIWCIGDKKDGLLTVVKDKKHREILEETLGLYKTKREVTQEEWEKLADKAAYASASAYASAYAYASASDYAYAYAHASAYAYAYAHASASAYAYAYAYAYASAHASASNFSGEFDKRILMMRDKLLKLLKAAK